MTDSAPVLPPVSRRLDLPGFSLGHGSDLRGMTGVTVLLCPEGAFAAAEVRGSATGTRQFDSLVSPHHVATRAHAVVLTGGSGFGLSSADPVVAWLAERGHGFQTGLRPVPLVPTAVLFDLGLGDPMAYPTQEVVEEALTQAERQATQHDVPVGSVGAGTGATVGKTLGPQNGMKGGFGFASLTVPEGPTVAAAVAVNAFGDVRDLEGRPVAGCRSEPDGLVLAGADRVLANLSQDTGHAWEGNTTLAVVMTDAALSKPLLFKVCQMAFGGLYRTLVPALSLFDGDLVVALSSGRREAGPAQVNQIGILAEWAVAEAILTAVREADGFGILPAASDLQRSQSTRSTA